MKICERIKAVRSVEFFVVFTVATFNFTVVPRSVRTNQLVPDAELLQSFLKERWPLAAFWKKSIREFGAIIGLDAFNNIWKLFHDMTQKSGRRVSAVFLKRLQIAKSTEFIQKRVLKPLHSRFLSHHANSGNEFDVDLNSLLWISHLLIRLRDILGEFYHRRIALAQKAVQSRNRPSVAAQTQFYPKHYNACVGAPSTHIQDELDLFRRMLVWMAMWPV